MNFKMHILSYFIATGEFEKAAIVLSKRKDPKLWQLGIYLAKLAEAHDLAASMTLLLADEPGLECCERAHT
jgi:hypothetical protein